MEGGNDCIVRLRGLPWAANPEDVMKFMEGCSVEGGEEGIHIMCGSDGRSSGEAYVELSSPDDVEKAMTKNKNHMGKRYIDVFKAKRAELEWALKNNGPRDTDMDSIVRLRGLPYGCSKEEIANFFSGLEIVPNGITILTDQFGRTIGDGFVQFSSPELVEEALKKHKENIGHRYIEVFKSCCDELLSVVNKLARQGGFNMGYGMQRSFNRPGYNSYNNMIMNYGRGRMGGRGGPSSGSGFYGSGYDGYVGAYGGGDCAGPGYGYGYGGQGFGYQAGGGYGRMGMRMGQGYGSGGMYGGAGKRVTSLMGRGGGIGTVFESQTGHSVHMRGLPYSATEEEIAQFFMPLTVTNISIQYNRDGRPSGDADVDFETHEEAAEAMKKHKALMNKRYIELFLRSNASQGTTSRLGTTSLKGNGFGNGCLYGGSIYTPF